MEKRPAPWSHRGAARESNRGASRGSIRLDSDQQLSSSALHCWAGTPWSAYVVTITGSTAGLPDIATATAHLISALLAAATH